MDDIFHGNTHDRLSLFPSSSEPPLTVSQLNQIVKGLLHTSFPGRIWVQGEISSLRTPRSGHHYFVLKDGIAETRCVMFSLAARRLDIKLRDGLEVILSVEVGLYEARGDFQLIADYATEVGDGALHLEFLRIKASLEAKGYFDPATKQAIPLYPERIGVITSSTGAALRDIIIVLKKRYPIANVRIYPSAVQGAAAEAQLVQAVQLANQRAECDVIILGRGGGSAEDLAVFNSESLAEAIFACSIPIVTGIGHETDTSIADLVADLRAATPSAAAQMATPDGLALQENLSQLHRRLKMRMTGLLGTLNQQVHNLHSRLRSPAELFRRQAQRFDFLDTRLRRAFPNQLRGFEQRLAHLDAQLRQLSPKHVLDRGYAIVHGQDAHIRSADQVAVGSQVSVELAEGKLYCLVEKVEMPHGE